MEPIKKSIYSLPEIRRGLEPLWWAWALVAAGAVCGVLCLAVPSMPSGLASLLAFTAAIGALALLLVLCFYLFGDSRRPYHKHLHTLLEPTVAYYSPAVQQQLVSALEAGDEAALDAVKRQPKPELVLMRYSDERESIFYSQLLRVDGAGWQPVTNIITNNLNNR